MAPPLVPEFSTILELDKEPTQANHKCLTSQLRGQDTEMCGQPEQPDLKQADKRQKKMFRVGVQQEPQEFLKAAMDVPHPMSPQRVLPNPLKAALFDNLTMDPVELAKSRLKAVVTIRSMARDLEEHEKQ
jgi:hypothetical protein